jgi:hypothetical protein
MEKCKALAHRCLSEGRSVVIDNTNPSSEVCRTPKHRPIINPVSQNLNFQHATTWLFRTHAILFNRHTSKSGHPTVCAVRGRGRDCQHSLQRLGVDTLLKCIVFCVAAGTGRLHLNRAAAQGQRSLFSHDCHAAGIGTLQQDTAREWVPRAGWFSLDPPALKGALAWHRMSNPQP